MAQSKGRAGNAGAEKYNTLQRSGVHERVDVTECDRNMLADVIERVTLDGDCIMFSRTSDGGALHVRILSEGIVAKWYPSKTTELNEVLQGITDDLTA